MTVRRLVQQPGLGLKLVAGRESAEHTISWAHAIELSDPTPYLSGGELVMTTGMRVGTTDAEQFDYVSRLSAVGVVALAFDTGTTHRKVPAGIVSAGDALHLPVLAVPEKTPFIAITRAVIDETTADEVRAVQRVVSQQEAMAREAVVSGIPSVVTSLGKALSATAVVVDTGGDVLAASGPDAQHVAKLAGEHVTHSAGRRTRTPSSRVVPDGDGVCLLQALGAIQPVRGCLAVRSDDPLSPTDRLLVSHAVSLISIELNKPTKVIDAEHRLRTAVTHALLRDPGSADPAVLRYFGFDPDGAIVVVSLDGIGPILPAEKVCQQILGRAGTPYLLCPHTDQIAVVLPDRSARLAGKLIDAVGAQLQRRLSAGISLPGGFADLPGRFAQARAAGQSYRGNGQLNAFGELGAFGVLLGTRTRDELRLITQPVAALQAHDRAHPGNESGLVRTLAAFLGHNGHLESAATELRIHRHTMRNRVTKIRGLTGRDLDSPDVRAQLWLAIKAGELLDIEADDDN